MDQALIKSLEKEKRARRRRLVAGTFVLLSLVLIGWIATSVRVFEVFIEAPEEDVDATVRVTSGLGFMFTDRAVVLSDTVELQINANFYDDLSILITDDTDSIIKAQLVPWTRTVRLRTEREDSFDWFLANRFITSASELVVETLPRDISYAAYFGDELVGQGDVQVGFRSPRNIDLNVPIEAVRVAIHSSPSGASVSESGEFRGVTPFVNYFSVLPNSLLVTLNGYKSTTINGRSLLEASGNVTIEMAPSTRLVSIDLRPEGGRLTGGELNKSRSYVNLPLDRKATLTYSKEGYVPKTLVVDAEQTAVKFQLKPAVGKLRVLEPVGATLKIGSKSYGEIPIDATLPVGDVALMISASGYVSKSEKVSIYLDESTDYATSLETEKEFLLRTSSDREVVRGIDLIRIDPDKVEIGAPRNERGQRANELSYSVNLTRAFYIGRTEISVQQYYSVMGGGLGNSSKPITDISWEDAAKFCNALSVLDGLEPFYRSVSGDIRGFNPNSRGYRLPSEAEWEFVTRKLDRRLQTRFIWGDEFELPEQGFGNLAVSEANSVAKRFIADKTDGYADLAPVGSFPGRRDISDLSGNVSEWVHDYYSIDTSIVGTELENYLGPRIGRQHFFKGSSYLSSSWTELRASFREPLDGGRSDVGFRIARYIY